MPHMGTYIKVEMCPNSQLAINALGGHNHGMKNRIASIRKKRGLSQSALAASLGTTLNMMGKLERGDRRLNSDWVVKLATALECDPSDLVGDEVPIVGKIGAGGSVIYEDVGVDETIGRPPDVDGRLVALEVAGFSMLPRFDDGDVIYIAREYDGVDMGDVGSLCACRLREGETYLKLLAKGARPGLWTLRSYNAPDIEDVELQWATPIRAIIPKAARRFF